MMSLIVVEFQIGEFPMIFLLIFCAHQLQENDIKIIKYQGVKEFHMLARTGCYSKVMAL